MTEQASHLDRNRAESFGAIAEDYDRYRPTYPDALITDIAAQGAAAVATRGGDAVEVVDVGCGTGIAARLLADRGLHVLGVEIDPGMAAVARRRGLDVELGSFESWDAAGRTFDLLTSGQAWHWVDPVAGAVKAAAVLRPGGTACLFWNMHAVADDFRPELDAVYEDVAPALAGRTQGPASRSKESRHTAVPGLEAAGFAVTFGEYDWQHTYEREPWLRLLSTFSDHHLLDSAQQERLLTGLGDVVERHGGTVTIAYTTYALFARRP